MTFNHIGIAVQNIEHYFKTVLQPVFNCEIISEIYTDVLQKSKIAFATTTDGTHIELIEPLGDDSPVSAILKNKKGGLYHLCFTAINFEEDIARCKKNNFILISSPKPAIAFNNRRVAFFFTPSNELIELLEEEEK